MSLAGYALIEACLAAGDRETFAARFLELAEWIRADQLMVFDFAGEAPACLLSRNFGQRRLGGLLAARYVEDGYRHDPLPPILAAVPEGEIRLCRMADFEQAMAADYRAVFFDRPGLAGKTALLAAGRQRRLMINFYHVHPPEAEDDDLLRLAARLLLIHFDAPGDSGYPAPLTALSERERAVCLGILGGQKAEVIAGNLGVSPATVVTYRRRAYEKLGINARAELFAICQPT
ncbi:helix-turn-helix transcriptional regulator [Amaricoccus sp. W119]|uniref:helix-turn-helix transcriptional regulator n=1 Tax=Amaricoccus sp. W119 TaxID=3391833 RepID=UPI0039A51F15